MLPKRHHWISMAIFIPVLLFGIYIVTVNSESYVVAKQFVEHDSQIMESIGKVKLNKFKFWSGFSFVNGDGGCANYSFNAITDRKVFLIKVHLKNISGLWCIKSADIYTDDVKQAQILEIAGSCPVSHSCHSCITKHS
jgi:hypothetical protein